MIVEHVDAVRRWSDTADAVNAGQVLLVGEDNPLSAAPEHALYCYPRGCAGERLQRLILDVPFDVYLGMWRTNLCVGEWSAARARERAGVLLAPENPWSVIVLLGKKVQTAFRTALVKRGYGAALETFTNTPVALGTASQQLSGTGPHVQLVALPHPSGLNRVWNTLGVIDRARQVFEVACSDVAPNILTGPLEGDS